MSSYDHLDDLPWSIRQRRLTLEASPNPSHFSLVSNTPEPPTNHQQFQSRHQEWCQCSGREPLAWRHSCSTDRWPYEEAADSNVCFSEEYSDRPLTNNSLCEGPLI